MKSMASNLDLCCKATLMMNTLKLNFLQDKISDLRSALFSNESEAVLKLPTTVVSALTVDEAGQVWFCVSKPTQNIQEFDREFPAKLNFFRKGKEFFLHITGKAVIINDPEELNNLVSLDENIRFGAVNNKYILLKMRIQQAEYYERHSHKYGMGWNKFVSKIFHWLFDHKPSMRPAFFLQDSAAA
jgi:general stress protein 26